MRCSEPLRRVTAPAILRSTVPRSPVHLSHVPPVGQVPRRASAVAELGVVRLRIIMSDIFQILTEAKIREWQNRSEEEKAAAASAEFQPSSSYEKQLLDEIIGLIKSTKNASQENAERKLSSAKNLEIQLMVSLEKQGLNLTARRIADEIRDHRNRSEEITQNAEQD